MDIYLLRDGKECGPFTEKATQTFLEQGAIVMDDLAWTPGLPSWSPLTQVLYPAAPATDAADEFAEEKMVIEFQQESVTLEEHEFDVAGEQPSVEEVAPGGVVGGVSGGESPTAKQRAFLAYIGISLSTFTTKEEAAIFVSEAMEDPKMSARVLQWNDDRLRLHPDIFSAELQAKKEDRANRYFNICLHEGADILVDVTKAHCQVLVAYLDVNFPNWDAHESDAPRSYFFPAVAEKFPSLVRKEWRDKLKYPSGPKIAAEFGTRNPSTRLHAAPSPIGALIRGVVFGLAVLLLLYVCMQIFIGEPATETAAAGEASPAPAAERPPKTVSEPEPAKPVAKAPPTEPAKNGMIAGLTDPAPPTAEPPAMDGTPAIPAEPKTRVTITKPCDVKLRYGSAKIVVGTEFKIIAQDAAGVTVIHLAETVRIPLENTDLATPLPAQ